MYDNSKLNKLDWDKIYKLFEREILSKIRLQQPKAVLADIKSSNSLNVKDSNDDNINFAFFSYVENNWQVVVSGLDVVEMPAVVTVKLEVPPPSLSNL